MPKMKTHSGAKKRFSLTGKGKVKFKRAGMRHILTKKSQNGSVSNAKGQLSVIQTLKLHCDFWPNANQSPS